MDPNIERIFDGLARAKTEYETRMGFARENYMALFDALAADMGITRDVLVHLAGRSQWFMERVFAGYSAPDEKDVLLLLAEYKGHKDTRKNAPVGG